MSAPDRASSHFRHATLAAVRYVIDGLTEQQVNVLRDIAFHVTRQIDKAAEQGVRRG